LWLSVIRGNARVDADRFIAAKLLKNLPRRHDATRRRNAFSRAAIANRGCISVNATFAHATLVGAGRARNSAAAGNDYRAAQNTEQKVRVMQGRDFASRPSENGVRADRGLTPPG
jgi:hypothetical protein